MEVVGSSSDVDRGASTENRDYLRESEARAQEDGLGLRVLEGVKQIKRELDLIHSDLKN